MMVMGSGEEILKGIEISNMFDCSYIFLMLFFGHFHPPNSIILYLSPLSPKKEK